MEYKYHGIILNKKDVGETDRIYTIYTLEVGKIRVMAKSVRLPKAKLAGFLEPITSAEIFLAKTRGLGKITGAIVNNNFFYTKSDLESLQQIFYAFKIFEKIISDQERDEKTYNLLLEYLEVMNSLSAKDDSENGIKKEIVTLGFLFKFLSEMGYQVEAKKCVKCNKKLISKENFFSAESGGVLCAGCASQKNNKIKIDDESIKFIRLFLKNNLSGLVKLSSSNKDVNRIKKIFSDFLHWIFGQTI